MTEPTIHTTLTVLAVIGGIFGIVLAIVSRVFGTEAAPRVEEIEEALPGANCGGCGFAGCAAYAEAIARGEAPPDACAPGGPDTATAIAGIMGVVVEEGVKSVAVIKCNGKNAKNRFDYVGEPDCRAANLIQGGFTQCTFGCLGLGTCVSVCPFDALEMKDGFPHVIEEKCVACGKCVEACPRNLIELIPLFSSVHVLCSSLDKGRDVKAACDVGCIGCKKCEKACPVDAIHVNDFLSRIDYEKCISCGKCVKECPTNAIGDFRQKRKDRGIYHKPQIRKKKKPENVSEPVQ